MPISGFDPIDPARYGAARTPDNILGIALIETQEDFETFFTRLSDCPSGLANECGESYSGYYSLESGFQAVLTPKQQPHTFQVVPVAPGNCDTAIDECCVVDPTNAIVVANPGVSPNNLFYTIAVKPSKKAVEAGCATGGCSTEDYNGLVKSLAEAVKAIQGDYPAFVLTAANLFVHKACCKNDLKCITDIAALVTAIIDELAQPDIIAGNPACAGIANLPLGTPVLIAGIDATGACVAGTPAVDPCVAIKAFPNGTPLLTVGVDAADNCITYRAIRKYSADHDFTSLVPLTINHNLSLLDPIAFVTEFREAIGGVGGGDDFAVQILSATANSIQVVSNTTQAAVRVTIIG